MELAVFAGGTRRSALFQTPKGVCLIGARADGRVQQRYGGFQTPKGVCLIGATGAVADGSGAADDSRRRKASASLEPDSEGAGRARISHSRRRKASASLEQRAGSRRRNRGAHSRRRKASASLELGQPASCSRSLCKFQTPKGVCLIGAARLRRRLPRRTEIPDAERRLPHWSGHLRALRNPHRVLIPDAERRLPHWSVDDVMASGETASIPDAERRLPHWSSSRRASLVSPPPAFQTPKGVCLIGAVEPLQPPPVDDQFQTPKGVCLIGAATPSETTKRGGPFQTPKGVCLIGALPSGGTMNGVRKIPDAERRLPHWSNG